MITGERTLAEPPPRAALERPLLAVVERFTGQHGRAATERVERCVRAYLGYVQPEYGDPRQRPVFLHFPGIRAQPYYDNGEFAWIALLESRFAAIRRELIAAMERPQSIELFFTNDRSPVKKLMPSWDAFFFFRYGRRYDDNHRLCPETSATLDALPLCHVPDFAPETLFSLLAPNGKIPPHRGVTNIRLVAHLPLVVPPKCRLIVADEAHDWREGRAVVFDDTYVHSAVNGSGERRAVLLIDVWHPDLTPIERNALIEIIATIRRFTRD
jgi:aspartate beta-hydroxylase